ncbi:chromosome segregation protein Spc25-domain-containing protein [Cyathus striatus]|nr:chromosome segregation protein Spc25-domain-containing protein [Cyathus striatus]
MTHILRVPQIDLTAVLADSNPSIDLKLQVYENSTRNFLKALTSYKNRAINTISERRKYQHAEKKKLHDRIHSSEAEINNCKLKEIELVADLEHEKEERKDAELSLAAFKRRLHTLQEKCATIGSDIDQYRAITDNLRREKDKERVILSTHASQVSPEVISCEAKLSCIIEGIEKDQLLIRFRNLDKQEPSREFSLVLDVSSPYYKVVTSSPHLMVLPILVDELNQHGDVYEFIKQVRMAYDELANT